MDKGEQIDKLSKKCCNIKQKYKKLQKRIHKRYLRKLAKDVDKPNPQSNRYSGFIG